MSKFEIRYFEEPAEFIQKWEEFAETGNYSIVYLTGAADAVTGKNWCPDCDGAKPFIMPVIEQA